MTSFFEERKTRSEEEGKVAEVSGCCKTVECNVGTFLEGNWRRQGRETGKKIFQLDRRASIEQKIDTKNKTFVSSAQVKE